MKKAMFFVISSFTLGVVSCQSDINYIQEEYQLANKEISSINLDVINRKINVYQSDDENIYMNYFDSNLEEINIDINNDSIDISLINNKKWYQYVSVNNDVSYRTVDLYVPIYVLDLTINTTNEDIYLSSLEANNISINNNNSDIDVNNININESINLINKNGNINGSIIGDQNEFKITCKIKKGNTNLPSLQKGGNKILNVNMNNGDVNINFLKN